ncbi:MAG: TIGR02594 family protein [Bauldia sp.]|nr:TIGR02594 family protein [Bauldia sp.]
MLPERYAWLARETGPRMIVEALKLFGTLEAAGSRNNPTIVAWAKEVGGEVADLYKADSIPWCGLFLAVVAKRAGKVFPQHPLWALSWSAFGSKVTAAGLGDVLVFTRKGGGHVGLYVGEDAGAFHVLGGNQSDRVCITRVARSRLYAARRPLYRVQPDNVRPLHLEASGALSLNEA